MLYFINVYELLVPDGTWVSLMIVFALGWSRFLTVGLERDGSLKMLWLVSLGSGAEESCNNRFSYIIRCLSCSTL